MWLWYHSLRTSVYNKCLNLAFCGYLSPWSQFYESIPKQASVLFSHLQTFCLLATWDPWSKAGYMQFCKKVSILQPHKEVTWLVGCWCSKVTAYCCICFQFFLAYVNPTKLFVASGSYVLLLFTNICVKSKARIWECNTWDFFPQAHCCSTFVWLFIHLFTTHVGLVPESVTEPCTSDWSQVSAW